MTLPTHRSLSISTRLRCGWILLLSVLLCWQSGCVQRRMTIRTNPPGALVYIDDYQIGTTPISTDFTYYGQRKIRLVKDGFETLTLMQSVKTPWYQIPPLDFISENLIPGEIRDQRTFSYQLTPQRVVPTEQLRARAEDLRRGILPVGALGPLSSTPSVGPTLIPAGPTMQPVPYAPEPIPTPEGVGGQPVYPLPSSNW